MALSKAKIIVERSSGQEIIEVMFNPTEYELDTANEFTDDEVPGLQTPLAQYTGGKETTLTMDLFFDSYELGEDVRKFTSKIANILDVDSDLHAPPPCRFVWGSLDFKGVLNSVKQRFTMFHESGVPVRATLSVSFTSTQSMKEQYQEIPRQSADRTKQRTVKLGDHLWMLAADEYDDPGAWRHIAEANGIDNPRELTPGRKLTIPRLE
ncbi:LysM peptidoglycan-binding domain-containing protein [Paenibacillus sp. NEAU-GSW1]|uniref:CIS tube protein n=1 Tax=Paenibacillus sp. NEAU-GSW1 TaxID=2682486 RepID=UPI0012E2D4C4|nr:LysM peptidoglycan-binding domain-containing protein [Paenibacillus sp. NEAU-GSW1]MUT65926.1 LysM peptidoglycan-binding domain-containing protein [Paenibacillus sp. NEAU-GSW1]